MAKIRTLEKKVPVEIANLGISPELFANIVQNNAESVLYQLLGLNLREVGLGVARLDLKVQQQHINFWQIIHGGVISVLVDAAMGAAVRSFGIQGVTIDLITHYLAPARPGDQVMAEGRVVFKGGKVLIAEADVWQNEEKLIAKARATFFNKGPLLRT
ncbi:MAG: PaaI family thioesterase [Firmicutes bacterium]|nr:PaaI family thioesterase [Bacillota bacterium]